jgi:hypothetical protein
MYQQVGGPPIGVLNDFDLSICLVDDADVASERTGTIPFIARASLEQEVGAPNRIHIHGRLMC